MALSTVSPRESVSSSTYRPFEVLSKLTQKWIAKTSAYHKTRLLRKKLDRQAKLKPKISLPFSVVGTFGGQKTIGKFSAIVMIVNQLLAGGVEILPEYYLHYGWLPIFMANLVCFAVATCTALMTAKAMSMIPGNQLFEKRYEYVATVRHFLGDATACAIEIAFHFLTLHSLLSFNDLVRAFDAFLLHPLFGWRISLMWFQSWIPRLEREPLLFDGNVSTLRERFNIPPWVSRLQADQRTMERVGADPDSLTLSLGYLVLSTLMICSCGRNLEDDQVLQNVTILVLSASWAFLVALALPKLPMWSTDTSLFTLMDRTASWFKPTAPCAILLRMIRIKLLRLWVGLRQFSSIFVRMLPRPGPGWNKKLAVAALAHSGGNNLFYHPPRSLAIRTQRLQEVETLLNVPGVTVVQLNYFSFAPDLGEEYGQFIRHLTDALAFGYTCGTCDSPLCFDALEVSDILVCPDPTWAGRIRDIRVQKYIEGNFKRKTLEQPAWPAIVKRAAQKFLMFTTFIRLWAINDIVPSLVNEIRDNVKITETFWAATTIAATWVTVSSLIVATSFPGLATIQGTSPVALIVSHYLPQPVANCVLLGFAIFTIAPGIIVTLITSRYNLVNSGKLTNRQALWLSSYAPFLLIWLAPCLDKLMAVTDILALIATLLCCFIAPILCYVAASNKSPLAIRDEVRKDILRLSISAFKPRHGEMAKVQAKLRHWARYAGTNDPQLNFLLRCSSPSKRARALEKQRLLYMQHARNSIDSGCTRSTSDVRVQPTRSRPPPHPELGSVARRGSAPSLYYHYIQRESPSGVHEIQEWCSGGEEYESELPQGEEDNGSVSSTSTPPILQLWRERYPIQRLLRYHREHAFEDVETPYVPEAMQPNDPQTVDRAMFMHLRSSLLMSRDAFSSVSSYSAQRNENENLETPPPSVRTSVVALETPLTYSVCCMPHEDFQSSRLSLCKTDASLSRNVYAPVIDDDPTPLHRSSTFVPPDSARSSGNNYLLSPRPWGSARLFNPDETAACGQGCRGDWTVSDGSALCSSQNSSSISVEMSGGGIPVPCSTSPRGALKSALGGTGISISKKKVTLVNDSKLESVSRDGHDDKGLQSSGPTDSERPEDAEGASERKAKSMTAGLRATVSFDPSSFTESPRDGVEIKKREAHSVSVSSSASSNSRILSSSTSVEENDTVSDTAGVPAASCQLENTESYDEDDTDGTELDSIPRPSTAHKNRSCDKTPQPIRRRREGTSEEPLPDNKSRSLNQDSPGNQSGFEQDTFANDRRAEEVAEGTEPTSGVLPALSLSPTRVSLSTPPRPQPASRSLSLVNSRLTLPKAIMSQDALDTPREFIDPERKASSKMGGFPRRFYSTPRSNSPPMDFFSPPRPLPSILVNSSKQDLSSASGPKKVPPEFKSLSLEKGAVVPGKKEIQFAPQSEIITEDAGVIKSSTRFDERQFGGYGGRTMSGSRVPASPCRPYTILRRQKTAAIRMFDDEEEENEESRTFRQGLENLRKLATPEWSHLVNQEVSELFPNGAPARRMSGRKKSSPRAEVGGAAEAMREERSSRRIPSPLFRSSAAVPHPSLLSNGSLGRLKQTTKDGMLAHYKEMCDGEEELQEKKWWVEHIGNAPNESSSSWERVSLDYWQIRRIASVIGGVDADPHKPFEGLKKLVSAAFGVGLIATTRSAKSRRTIAPASSAYANLVKSSPRGGAGAIISLSGCSPPAASQKLSATASLCDRTFKRNPRTKTIYKPGFAIAMKTPETKKVNQGIGQAAAMSLKLDTLTHDPISYDDGTTEQSMTMTKTTTTHNNAQPLLSPKIIISPHLSTDQKVPLLQNSLSLSSAQTMMPSIATGERSSDERPVLTTDDHLSVSQAATFSATHRLVNVGRGRERGSDNVTADQQDYAHKEEDLCANRSQTEEKDLPTGARKIVFEITPKTKSQTSAFLRETNTGTSDVGVGNSEIGNSEVGTSKVGTSKVGTSKVGTSEVGTSEVGTSEVGTSKVGTSEVGTSEVGEESAEIGADSAEVGTLKVGSSEFGTGGERSMLMRLRGPQKSLYSTATFPARREGVASEMQMLRRGVSATRVTFKEGHNGGLSSSSGLDSASLVVREPDSERRQGPPAKQGSSSSFETHLLESGFSWVGNTLLSGIAKHVAQLSFRRQPTRDTMRSLDYDERWLTTSDPESLHFLEDVRHEVDDCTLSPSSATSTDSLGEDDSDSDSDSDDEYDGASTCSNPSESGEAEEKEEAPLASYSSNKSTVSAFTEICVDKREEGNIGPSIIVRSQSSERVAREGRPPPAANELHVRRQKVRRIEVFPFLFLKKRHLQVSRWILYFLCLLPFLLAFLDYYGDQEVSASSECDLVIDASSLFDQSVLVAGEKGNDTIRKHIDVDRLRNFLPSNPHGMAPDLANIIDYRDDDTTPSIPTETKTSSFQVPDNVFLTDDIWYNHTILQRIQIYSPLQSNSKNRRRLRLFR